MITEKLKKELLFEFFLFAAAIITISLLYMYNLILTVLLFIGWVLAVILWHKKNDIYFFIVGAIIGPIGEIIAIYFGAWQYANPAFLGIPIWLPLVWGLAVVLIKRIAEIFVKVNT